MEAIKVIFNQVLTGTGNKCASGFIASLQCDDRQQMLKLSFHLVGGN